MAAASKKIKFIKYLIKKDFLLIFIAAILSLIAVSPVFAADELTFDEKLAKCLEKSEEIGLLKVCVIDNDKKQKTVITINKFSAPAKNEPPASCLAVFDGKTFSKITPFSTYVNAMEAVDIDNDGISEIIYSEKDGMADFLQVHIIKFCSGQNKNDYSFIKLFKSEEYRSGKFDIIKPGQEKELPKIIIGGFVKAPGLNLSNVEYSHTFSVLAGKDVAPKIVKTSQYYTTPKSNTEEYEYAYAMYSIEKNKIKALNTLKILIAKLEKAKDKISADDKEILSLAQNLVKEIKL